MGKRREEGVRGRRGEMANERGIREEGKDRIKGRDKKGRSGRVRKRG